jgi:hypothetical protein
MDARRLSMTKSGTWITLPLFYWAANGPVMAQYAEVPRDDYWLPALHGQPTDQTSAAFSDGVIYLGGDIGGFFSFPGDGFNSLADRTRQVSGSELGPGPLALLQDGTRAVGSPVRARLVYDQDLTCRL